MTIKCCSRNPFHESKSGSELEDGVGNNLIGTVVYDGSHDQSQSPSQQVGPSTP